MDRSEIKRRLEAAQRDLSLEFQKIREAQGCVAVLQKTIRGLETLHEACELAERQKLGAFPESILDRRRFTDASRIILRSASHPLTPIEVRDRFLAFNYDLSYYSNPLAVIHRTLKRLEANGEAESQPTSEGKNSLSVEERGARCTAPDSGEVGRGQQAIADSQKEREKEGDWVEH